MKSATKGASSSTKGLLDEKSQREHDDIMEELLSHGRDASFSSTQSDSETKEREAKESEDEDADLLAQMHAFVRKGNGAVPLVGVDGTPFSPYDFNNTEGKQRPWINTTSSASTGAEIAMSPTDIEATTPFGSRGPSAAGDANLEEKAKQVSLGFEDDFTVFVSAPPAQKPRALNLGDAAFGAGEVDGPDIPTPTATGAITTDGLGLAPESAAHRSVYRSLGSVSDFGGSDDGREHEAPYEALEDDDGEEWEDVDSDDDDEDEEGLPSKEEVKEAAARIFGPGLGGVGAEASSSSSSKSNPSGGPAGASTSTSTSDSGPPAAMLERMRMLGRMAAQQDIMMGMAAMGARSGAAASARRPGGSASVPEDGSFDPDAGDGDDGDSGPGVRPFDLEKVFGALQQYKSEIAGMANEEERRRAAAKVALGLVYGLEGGKP
ncbi:unnamed protein product [Cyclocybe aegerita]|uniref:Uncharacterized protein n=1 Tax=Cyclocybe aegerita TaxID=1973307 RepID=A0A8S0W558_CYCAE|nr:unnamed protein product [Cyclocybe aegerita]